MRPVVFVVVVALVALAAGCSAPPDEDQGIEAPADMPMLSGYVLDPAYAPIGDVVIEAPVLNASATTAAGGHYAFADLPRGEAVLLTAQREGFVPASRSVTVPEEGAVFLNWTLVPLPAAVPDTEVLDFNGFLPCQTRYGVGGDRQGLECSGGLGERADVWEFSVGPDLAGIVIEMVWEAGTPAAQLLNATVETVGYGDGDAILAQVEGPSVLRAQVNNAQADTFYRSGGIVRVTVGVGADADEEAGASAGAAVNQDFEAFASVFYVEPPPPTYTVMDT